MTDPRGALRAGVPAASPAAARVAVVVPMRDEQPNVEPLLDELWPVAALFRSAPVWIIDDGSSDGTATAVRSWRDRRATDGLHLLQFAESRGQSAAVLAGVEAASAEFVLIMDGDRQNDPADFAAMLALLEDRKADAVVGVRSPRRDSWVRRMSSVIGNSARNWITGDVARDSACGIKGIRRDLYLSLPRFDGMHRFVPTLARALGGRVVEYSVRHRPRPAGTAKYGIRNRAWRGLRDCWHVRKLVRAARIGGRGLSMDAMRMGTSRVGSLGDRPSAGSDPDDQVVA